MPNTAPQSAEHAYWQRPLSDVLSELRASPQGLDDGEAVARREVFGPKRDAAALPLTPIRAYFGFVPPPPQFYLALVGIVVAYLAAVQVAKRAFYGVAKNKP